MRLPAALAGECICRYLRGYTAPRHVKKRDRDWPPVEITAT